MFTDEAVRHFGTKTQVAKALGLGKQAVSEWGEIVPKGRAYELQAITGGLLRVRPDLYETARDHH